MQVVGNFSGADFQPPRDGGRLAVQYVRIFALMRDGVWRTLDQIAQTTQDPPASVSAQLRNVRKGSFGRHTLNRRYIGQGLYEYQLVLNPEGIQ